MPRRGRRCGRCYPAVVMRSLATATVVVTVFTPIVAGETRHAGSMQGFEPSAGLIFVREIAGGGTPTVVAVDIRDARIVRVWREPADPERWHERRVRIHRLPIGTFVVVVGNRGLEGVIKATRVEVPEVPDSARRSTPSE